MQGRAGQVRSGQVGGKIPVRPCTCSGSARVRSAPALSLSLSLSLSCLPFGVERKGLCHVKLPALDSTHTRPIRCFFPNRQARRNEGKEFTERLLRRPYVHTPLLCPARLFGPSRGRARHYWLSFFYGHCSLHCDTGEETNLIFLCRCISAGEEGAVL
jgi:hypothetical protein